MPINKYRKVPVEIEAVQWTGNNMYEIIELNGGKRTLNFSYENRLSDSPTTPTLCIETLEGWHYASIGDYIIRGVKGEIYPCKPDIFKKTYMCPTLEGRGFILANWSMAKNEIDATVFGKSDETVTIWFRVLADIYKRTRNKKLLEDSIRKELKGLFEEMYEKQRLRDGVLGICILIFGLIMIPCGTALIANGKIGIGAGVICGAGAWLMEAVNLITWRRKI